MQSLHTESKILQGVRAFLTATPFYKGRLPLVVAMVVTHYASFQIPLLFGIKAAAEFSLMLISLLNHRFWQSVGAIMCIVLSDVFVHGMAWIKIIPFTLFYGSLSILIFIFPLVISSFISTSRATEFVAALIPAAYGAISSVRHFGPMWATNNAASIIYTIIMMSSWSEALLVSLMHNKLWRFLAQSVCWYFIIDYIWVHSTILSHPFANLCTAIIYDYIFQLKHHYPSTIFTVFTLTRSLRYDYLTHQACLEWITTLLMFKVITHSFRTRTFVKKAVKEQELLRNILTDDFLEITRNLVSQQQGLERLINAAVSTETTTDATEIIRGCLIAMSEALGATAGFLYSYYDISAEAPSQAEPVVPPMLVSLGLPEKACLKIAEEIDSHFEDVDAARIGLWVPKNKSVDHICRVAYSLFGDLADSISREADSIVVTDSCIMQDDMSEFEIDIIKEPIADYLWLIQQQYWPIAYNLLSKVRTQFNRLRYKYRSHRTSGMKMHLLNSRHINELAAQFVVDVPDDTPPEAPATARPVSTHDRPRIVVKYEDWDVPVPLWATVSIVMPLEGTDNHPLIMTWFFSQPVHVSESTDSLAYVTECGRLIRYICGQQRSRSQDRAVILDLNNARRRNLRVLERCAEQLQLPINAASFSVRGLLHDTVVSSDHLYQTSCELQQIRKMLALYAEDEAETSVHGCSHNAGVLVSDAVEMLGPLMRDHKVEASITTSSLYRCVDNGGRVFRAITAILAMAVYHCSKPITIDLRPYSFSHLHINAIENTQSLLPLYFRGKYYHLSLSNVGAVHFNEAHQRSLRAALFFKNAMISRKLDYARYSSITSDLDDVETPWLEICFWVDETVIFAALGAITGVRDLDLTSVSNAQFANILHITASQQADEFASGAADVHSLLELFLRLSAAKQSDDVLAEGPIEGIETLRTFVEDYTIHYTLQTISKLPCQLTFNKEGSNSYISLVVPTSVMKNTDKNEI